MIGKTKVILCNYNKGGVGKTTLAVHITGILLEQKQGRILLVDCDARPDSWRFYMKRRPTGSEGFIKINSRLSVFWNQPRDKGAKFQRIQKTQLLAYDYMIIDSDNPPEDTVIMINNHRPDLILIPLNKSQRHSLEDIPDFLELIETVDAVANLNPDIAYYPQVKIVPLGVSQEIIGRSLAEENCEIAPAMRDVQDEMVEALGEKNYIWNYSSCEDLRQYFISLLEI